MEAASPQNDPILDWVVLQTAQRPPSHDIAHFIRVQDIALQIANELTKQIDILRRPDFNPITVIKYAALLHDLTDHKYTPPNLVEQEQKNMTLFLSSFLCETEIEAILKITKNVSYSLEKKGLLEPMGEWQLLRDIVSDADKIDAIGSSGLERCIQYSKETEPEASQQQILEKVKLHCQEKLVHLFPDFIRTKPGRDRALPLHNVIVEYIEQH